MNHKEYIEAKKKELGPIIRDICLYYKANSITIEAGCDLVRDSHYCLIKKLNVYK